MRRGTFFPYAHDSAHWVDGRGVRELYDAQVLHRIGDPARGARLQTSSRPVGVAMNHPALQRFGAPLSVNTPDAVVNQVSGGPTFKWRRMDVQL